jgi:LPS export ABC transporter permease LptG/LPS export ABC transporter permease LptF
MRILGRYVFREILAGTFLAIVIATFAIFLQHIGPLFELLVRSKNAVVALELISFGLMQVLLLSIPFGMLVGVLIGLGRMSGDNEMVAMRSTGVSTRRVATPVLLFAAFAAVVSGATALWLNPLAIRQQYKLLNKIAGEQITANVPPRIFQEQFTNDNTVLYVDDVSSGTGPAVWKRIVIADTSAPAQRKSTRGGGHPAGPVITLAREAVAFPDEPHGRIQLHMFGQSTHESSIDEQKGERGIHTLAPTADMALDEAPPREQTAKAFQDMLTRDLRSFIRGAKKGSQEWIDASLELHRRLALPAACIMLAMIGIPLGTSSKRGGRSSGYVWAIFLCFCCYYLAFISLTHTAQKSHTLSPMVASWLPNLIFGAAGVILIARMESPGDRDILGGLRGSIVRWGSSLASRIRAPKEPAQAERRSLIHVTLFRIMDNHVLTSFLFYFAVWILAFVAMTQIYNFFELLGDIVKNNIRMSDALQYHLFLTPELIYRLLPFGVLLAVLVTFGIMTKNNEVTAFKACGISVRRLGIPVILMSGVISVAAFAADYSWIPRANQIQNGLRNQIKGRPAQTYRRPDRQWVFHDNHVFYFRHFDIEHSVMAEPWVYEIDPKTWQLTRQINARSARWAPDVHAWIFEQGQVIDICQRTLECHVENFTATSFPEITETPDNTFLKEVKQDLQMNYVELGHYIRDLNEAGFDTLTLQVQYYKKFAVPLFAFTIALISVPFGFLVGNRGAMAGVGVSIGLAIAYLAIGTLFEQMGNVGYLRPDVAAWAPNALFSLSGLYLILRMRS